MGLLQPSGQEVSPNSPNPLEEANCIPYLGLWALPLTLLLLLQGEHRGPLCLTWGLTI